MARRLMRLADVCLTWLLVRKGAVIRGPLRGGAWALWVPLGAWGSQALRGALVWQQGGQNELMVTSTKKLIFVF